MATLVDTTDEINATDPVDAAYRNLVVRAIGEDESFDERDEADERADHDEEVIGGDAAPPPGDAEAVMRNYAHDPARFAREIAQKANLVCEYRGVDRDLLPFLAADDGGPGIRECRLREILDGIYATLGLAPDDRRAPMRDLYNRLVLVLRCAPIGKSTDWADWFWKGTEAAKLVYIGMYAAYGNGLRLNKQIANETRGSKSYGINFQIARLGQLQRTADLEYIENPWITHTTQRVRRVTYDMIEGYVEHKVSRQHKGEQPGDYLPGED